MILRDLQMACSKTTKRCNPEVKSKNYFLKDCCRNNLMQILLELPYILENRAWWLDFGTLLGFYRDGKIIDWDSDLDIGVLYEDFYKNEIEIKKRVQEKGFYFTKISNNFYRINFSSTNLLHCDLFLFKNKNGVLKTAFDEYFSKHDEIFPLNKMVILDKEFNVPHDIEYFLKTRYGDSWKTPISRANGYKAIKRKV